jgi:hypothetical protein
MGQAIRAGLLASTLLLQAGCGPGSARLAPVEGVVKIDGKPVANLLVQFHHTPKGGGRPVSASGISDASGRFVLRCGDAAGAPEGENKVTLIDNNLVTDEEPGPTSKRLPPNRVPREYMSSTTTPLNVVVEPGKKAYELNVQTGRR